MTKLNFPTRRRRTRSASYVIRPARAQREIIWAASTRNKTLMRICTKSDKKKKQKNGAPSVLKPLVANDRVLAVLIYRSLSFSLFRDFFCTLHVNNERARTRFTSARAIPRSQIIRSCRVTRNDDTDSHPACAILHEPHSIQKKTKQNKNICYDNVFKCLQYIQIFRLKRSKFIFCFIFSVILN